MFKKSAMALATRGAVAASRTAPVPYAQSEGLAIYRFETGEPVLFMPYPHAASVIGDPMPTAIVNPSHPAFWHFGLWAAVYQLTRRLAAQKLMLNVVIQASWVERSRALQQHVSLRDWLRPAHPRTQWGQVARRLDYRPRLGEVGARTLVLVGCYDPQTPPSCAQELAWCSSSAAATTRSWRNPTSSGRLSVPSC
jgi:hypothetical protein